MSLLDILNVKKVKSKFHNKLYREDNSYGYRSREFNTYEWGNSILFLGCSHVYGMGNYIEDTIPYLITKLSGETTINMGICGGSIDTVYHNTFALIEKGYIPKQVVVLWPQAQRQLYYKGAEIGSNKVGNNLGSWSEKGEAALWHQHILSTENYMTKAYLGINAVNKAWQLESVKVLNFSILEKDLEKYQNGKITFTHLPKRVDTAHDGIHFGPKTHLNYAKIIHKYL